MGCACVGELLPLALGADRGPQSSGTRPSSGGAAGDDKVVSRKAKKLSLNAVNENGDVLNPFGRRGSLLLGGGGLAGPSDSKANRCCSRCGGDDDGLPRGNEFICRECTRKEDEARLRPSPTEQVWLDRIAAQLNLQGWEHWKPGEQPAQILDWLYLGDLKEALDIPSLERRGIGAVLNVIDWWELGNKLRVLLPDVEAEDLGAHYDKHNFRYRGVDLEDRLFSDIAASGAWSAASEFLESCRSRFLEAQKGGAPTKGLGVVVNCVAGHNRSAAIVVSWLVLRERFDIVEACAHAQDRRGCILSNHGYRLNIVRMAMKAGLLPDVPPPASAEMDGAPFAAKPDAFRRCVSSEDGGSNDIASIVLAKRAADKWIQKVSSRRLMEESRCLLESADGVPIDGDSLHEVMGPPHAWERAVSSFQ